MIRADKSVAILLRQVDTVGMAIAGSERKSLSSKNDGFFGTCKFQDCLGKWNTLSNISKTSSLGVADMKEVRECRLAFRVAEDDDERGWLG